jgi:hypothetical protein
MPRERYKSKIKSPHRKTILTRKSRTSEPILLGDHGKCFKGNAKFAEENVISCSYLK